MNKCFKTIIRLLKSLATLKFIVKATARCELPVKFSEQKIVRLSYIKLIKRLYITSGEFLTSYLFQTGTKEIDESDREYLVCDNFFKLHITKLKYG